MDAAREYLEAGPAGLSGKAGGLSGDDKTELLPICAGAAAKADSRMFGRGRGSCCWNAYPAADWGPISLWHPDNAKNRSWPVETHFGSGESSFCGVKCIIYIYIYHRCFELLAPGSLGNVSRFRSAAGACVLFAVLFCTEPSPQMTKYGPNMTQVLADSGGLSMLIRVLHFSWLLCTDALGLTIAVPALGVSPAQVGCWDRLMRPFRLMSWMENMYQLRF